eukprot:g20686.t1
MKAALEAFRAEQHDVLTKFVANYEGKSLNLSRQNLGQVGASAVAEGLQENKTLRELNIHDNNIGPDGAKAFAKALEVNKSITTLNLNWNNIGPDGAAAIRKALEVNSSLTQLSLWNNKIGNAGAIAIGKGLEVNNSIHSIELDENDIGVEGAKAIGLALQVNKTLKALTLDGNKIGDEGATYISSALKANNSIRSIDLRGNGIGDEGAKAIGLALQVNPILKQLSGVELKNHIQGLPQGVSDNERILEYLRKQSKIKEKAEEEKKKAAAEEAARKKVKQAAEEEARKRREEEESKRREEEARKRREEEERKRQEAEKKAKEAAEKALEVERRKAQELLEAQRKMQQQQLVTERKAREEAERQEAAAQKRKQEEDKRLRREALEDATRGDSVEELQKAIEAATAIDPSMTKLAAATARLTRLQEQEQAKQEAAAQQRKQEQDKKLRREALQEMQKEADMYGGLQYLHAHGMFVGKSGAGKSSVLEAMQNVPHEAKKGSTKGADLVEIQIAHVVSGGSGWRAVKPGEDTLTEQQRVMALNLAAKINERQQGGGKSVVVEQASLEDFQRNKVELQRQRKRPHIEESPLLEQDVPLVLSATASSVSGEDQKKLPSPRPTAPDPSTSATRTSPATATPSPSPSTSAAATFPSTSAAAATSSTSAALLSSLNLKQTQQQTEVPKEGSHLMDGELLLGMVEDGKIKGDELSLSLWDMGGQDVFHSLHHLFLKRGALFLVLFDMRELVEGADPKQKQECLSHLRFWLRSLETHTFEEGNGWAPVFLVGTHKDFVTKESEHKHIAEVLDREFGGSSFYNTKKLYTPPNGRDFPFFPVDNKVRPVDPTVQALMKALEATARNEEYIKRKIPVPWVKLFDKLFQQAKKQSWLSREEVVQLATQCGLANPTNNIDLVLRYLHDQGRVLYFADQPSLHDLVILDPTNFFLEPVTRIICEFDTHRIPAHDEAIKSLSSAWTKLKSSGMLEKRLLPILWADRSEETREYLLALMIKFGLAVELQADASEAADEVVFLVPALLPKEPHSLKKPKSLEVSCSIGFYPREERAAAEPETIEERVKTVGFLPSGFFSRLLGKCFTWSQGWSAGVNWNDGWSEYSTPAQLFQKRALLSFGALRFEMTVFDDLNILRVRCGDKNPRALLRRLLLLCEEVIEEALGGALLVRPYLEHEGTMVRLEKAQDAVRRGVKLLFDDKWLLPEQIKEKFSPHWFPPAQPPSKFDAFWCFREGPFDSALVGKLQDRLLDMGVPPFHMAQKGLRSEQTLDALTRSRLMVLLVSVQGLQPLCELKEESKADPVLVEWALALELLEQKRLQRVLPLLVGPNADRSRNEPAFLQSSQGFLSEDRLPDVVVKAVVSAVTEGLKNANLTPSKRLQTRTVRETYQQLMAHGQPWSEDVAANALPSKRARGDAVSLVNIPLLSLKLQQAMDEVRVAEGTGESQKPAEVATAIAKQTESDAEAEFRGQIEQAAKQAETLLKDKKAQQQLQLSKDMRVEAQYVAFLSHAQAQAGDLVRTIYLELDRKCWYDKEQVERTLVGMVKGIAMSEVFLIYVSKSYFTRPYCRFELQVARLLEKPIVVVREASLRPTRGPIDLPQIAACDKQLVEFDILALSDELRDAFSTGFIPLLKARINTALGKEVLATATPASATAAAAPAASPTSPAPQAATGAGVLTQDQLDALAAVELDADTLLHIEDEDLNEFFTALSVSAPNKLKIKAARRKLQSSVLAAASTSSPPAAALPATTPAAPSSFSSSAVPSSAPPSASLPRSPGPRAPPPSSPAASSPSTSLARPRALFPSSPPASSSPSSSSSSSAACGAFTPAGASNAAVWAGSNRTPEDLKFIDLRDDTY